MSTGTKRRTPRLRDKGVSGKEVGLDKRPRNANSGGSACPASPPPRSLFPDEALAQVREEMGAHGLDAYIVGSEDAHHSEYVSLSDRRLEFVSSFSGSAGTAIILRNKALLWTDGRYFLQAEKQLSKQWELMRTGEVNVPSFEDWLSDLTPTVLRHGAVLGVDPKLVTMNDGKVWRRSLKAADSDNERPRELRLVGVNLVDKVWGSSRPAQPARVLRIHPLCYSGMTVEAKLGELRADLRKSGAFVTFLTALDDIAWVFNIRGSDVPCTPVALAYAMITLDEAVLYVNEDKITKDVLRHLSDARVRVAPYEGMEDALKMIASQPEKGKVLVDPSRVSLYVSMAFSKNRIVPKPCPVAIAKAIKNQRELEGLISCHIRDGAALTSFLAWLEEAIQSEKGGLTEHSIAEKLEGFREKQPGYVGLSFPAIVGYGPNGAIIHYRASEEGASAIGAESLLLIDSGGQYVDGTTDITRTVHFGKPSEYERRCFTLVLKGHIALASAIIPEGVKGSKLDVIARLAMWREGLDYNHGTGHGVGAHLCVHEGLHGIHFRATQGEQGLVAGMTTSNEPGYYEEGSFGIRIENVCVLREVNWRQKGLRQSLQLETISLAPIQLNLVNVQMLTDEELHWLNEYHLLVREKILPLVSSDARATKYLLLQTECLTRTGTVTKKK